MIYYCEILHIIRSWMHNNILFAQTCIRLIAGISDKINYYVNVVNEITMERGGKMEKTSGSVIKHQRVLCQSGGRNESSDFFKTRQVTVSIFDF